MEEETIRAGYESFDETYSKMDDENFKQMADGEWRIVRARGINRKHLHKCCDCGLVHEVKYRLYERIESLGDNTERLRRLNLDHYAIGMSFTRKD